MDRLVASLFSRVVIEPSGNPKPDAAAAAVANLELALYGYTLAPDALAALTRAGHDGVAEFRSRVTPALAALSGSDVDHSALFNRFPYETPDHFDYLVRRVIGHLRNKLGRKSNHTVLSCGHAIDSDLFPDPSAFSACPICQFQVDELSGSEEIRHEFKALSPLKPLAAADRAFLTAQAHGFMSRNSSLSRDEKLFLRMAIERFGMEVPDKAFKETVPFAWLAAGKDADSIAHLVTSATDALRIAAFASDPDSDLSLAEPVRFKLSRSEGKSVLSLVDRFEPRPAAEDMLRRRERWIRLGEALHPGSRDNRRRFPRAAAAFDLLRRTPAAVETFNRQVHRKVASRDADGDLLSLLSSRPGEFIRRLDFLLRETDDTGPVLSAVPAAAAEVPDRLLLTALKHFAARGSGDERAFAPKGDMTRLKVVKDTRRSLPDHVAEAARKAIEDELTERWSKLPPLGNVYVDPSLGTLLVDFNRRGGSSTAAPASKGSRFSYGNPPVVRLFTHWKGDIDVDLSLALFDDGFSMLEQVSYTNLRSDGYGIVHSGDVQNAPRGASEFIDFSPERLLAQGVRYAVAHVISFRGDGFNTFPCFAGYMERDRLKSGQKYEPQSVALKFDVTSRATEHLPLIFDLRAGEAIFADIAGGKGRHRNILSQEPVVAQTARAVLDMPRTRPTVHDVAMLHARARGNVVDGREEADTLFDRDTLASVDVSEPEEMARFSANPSMPDRLRPA